MYGAYSSFARYYDALQKCSGTDYNLIGGYYKKVLEKNGITGGILLDLACGTGAMSRYFDRTGFDVIGTDASPDMLNEACSKSNNHNIQYLMQDMTELDLFGTVDACICVLDGTNHLADRNEVKKAFEKIALFMNPQGVFVFDVNTIHKHKDILAGSIFSFDLDDIFCVWRNFINELEPEKVDIELDFFEKYKLPDNKIKNSDLYKRSSDFFSEQAYGLNELAKMLRESGFEVAGCYDWLTFDEGDEDCEKVVFVAKKIK